MNRALAAGECSDRKKGNCGMPGEALTGLTSGCSLFSGEECMRFEHTDRHGFLLGFIDFFTAGLFFLVYMRLGLQDELDEITGRKTQSYTTAYLLGIPTLFIYTLVWMARIAEELKERALELGIEGKHTSFRHMFCWNVFGIFAFGPMIATYRFFRTLNRIETELNKRNDEKQNANAE